MQLDRVRIKRFFHVEHPIGAASLCYKFKVRNEVVHFGHTAFEVAHHTLERFDIRCGCHKLFRKSASIGILFQERCRVRFVFRKDAVCVGKAAASVLLLCKFLANLHEEAVQGLFGFGKRFGEFIAKFMEFGLFCRNAACNFGNEAIATNLRRFKRFRDVSESKERDGAPKRLVADFGQAVSFVKHDVFIRREQSKIELQVGKEKRMVHKHHVCIHGLTLCHKCGAVIVMRAFFAKARRSVARKLRPKYAIAALAKRIAIVDVARFGCHYPRNECHERITLFNGKEFLRVHEHFFKLAEAKVIVAAF